MFSQKKNDNIFEIKIECKHFLTGNKKEKNKE